MDKYEKMARFYIEGNAGLFDFYKYELASPLCYPPEVEGARWILICLTNPANRRDLEAVIEQADLRMKTEAVKLEGMRYSFRYFDKLSTSIVRVKK